MARTRTTLVRASTMRAAATASASLVLLAAALPAQVAVPDTAQVDTQAVNALRRMGAHLRTLPRFRMHADATRDEVTPGGQKVQLGGTFDYWVRAPNGLRVDVKSDRKHRSFYYDGDSLTVYAPRMQYYAKVAAPPTIGAMLDSVSRAFGLQFPVADVFRWGTESDGVKDLTAAWYVGPALIDSVDTDHYAFRQPGTDWQIWIQRGDRPLLKKVVITTTSEPSQPQYVAVLDWDLTAGVDDSMFAFTPPSGASRIRMTPVEDVVATTPPER